MERIVELAIVGFTVLSEIALCIISLVLNKSRIRGCTKNSVLGLVFGSLASLFFLLSVVSVNELSMYWSYLVFVIIFSIVALPFSLLAIFKAMRALKKQDDRVKRLPNGKKEEEALSQADEILKFKELLDKGVITQEEFDMKKKRILER